MLIDAYRGALLGLAAGDALGTTVEFRHHGSFRLLTDIAGGGPFHLVPGQWTTTPRWHSAWLTCLRILGPPEAWENGALGHPTGEP
jgi:hypothetical protein